MFCFVRHAENILTNKQTAISIITKQCKHLFCQVSISTVKQKKNKYKKHICLLYAARFRNSCRNARSVSLYLKQDLKKIIIPYKMPNIEKVGQNGNGGLTFFH